MPPTSWTAAAAASARAHPSIPSFAAASSDEHERDQVRDVGRRDARSAVAARGARPPSRARRDRAVEPLLEEVRDAAAYETSWTTPPSARTTISRSGRSTASSTRRSGFVKPALVQSSGRSTSCPQAHVGAGAATRRPRSSDEGARERDQRERDPTGSDAGSRQVEPDRRRSGVRPGREAHQRPEQEARRDARARRTPPRARRSPQPHRRRRRPPRARRPRAVAGRAARARRPSRSRAPRARRSRRARRARAPRRSRPPTPPKAGTCSSACSVSHSDAKPLRGGSPAIATAPTRKAPPVHGMRRSSPPSRSSSSEPTAFSNDPAPRKSSALNSAWFTVWSSAAASASAAHSSAPRARSIEAGAEAEHDDPDVLDRVKREQPLELVLEERVRRPRRPPRARRVRARARRATREHAEPVDEHADEPVDRDLDHHAAHQRRDVRGRDRMRPRQPDVQRHHAGLRPHPDERRQRDRDLQPGAGRDRARVADRALAARAGGRRPRCRRRRGGSTRRR